MAAVVEEELQRDSENQPTKVYWVEDDAGAALSFEDAQTAVLAVAPSSIDGATVTDARREQISDFVWRFTLSYSVRQLRPLKQPPTNAGTASYEDGFQFRAKRTVYKFAEPISTTPAGAPDLQGLIGFQKVGADREHAGLAVDPPPVARYRKYAFSNAQVSSTYLSLVEAMCVGPGVANSAPIFGRGVGEVCLVSANLVRRDDSSLSAYFGFGYLETKTYSIGNETVDVKGGQTLYAPFTKRVVSPTPILGKKIIIPFPLAAYVYQLRPTGDLNNLFPS